MNCSQCPLTGLIEKHLASLTEGYQKAAAEIAESSQTSTNTGSMQCAACGSKAVTAVHQCIVCGLHLGANSGPAQQAGA
jgi:hypothetical protein